MFRRKTTDDASAGVRTQGTMASPDSPGDGHYDYTDENDLESCGIEQTLQPLPVPELVEGYVRHSGNCLPYRREVFRQQLDGTAPGSGRRLAILEALKGLGVRVFVIDARDCRNTGQVLAHVKRITGFIARENRVLPWSGPLGFERALLYQDEQGRLFNLVFSQHAVGPAERWKECLDSFSGLEAMVALVVLIRSLPCATQDEITETFKPAFISLILGLVLTEEISLSWLNTSMLVRATPSVSAHVLFSPFGPDALRKLVLFVLTLASAATGQTQMLLVLLGIVGACAVLLANLGSRAWHFLRWKPQGYNWCLAGLMAYLSAILTGIMFPYLGHRNIMVGGKAAVEYVIRTSFLVALAFVVSDFDEVQRFLVIGSVDCDQSKLNLAVSIWFFLTTITSLCIVRRIPYRDQKPTHAERLLEPDHSSPSGYRVPSLPDYEIDPSLARTGIPCVSPNLEFAFGVILAITVSGAMIYLSYTQFDESLSASLNKTISEIF